jgi:hypothetical protein
VSKEELADLLETMIERIELTLEEGDKRHGMQD